MTVRRKVLLLMLGFSVIPMIVLTVLGLSVNLGTIRDLYMDRLDKLAVNSAAALSEIIDLYKDEVRHYAESDAVLDYLRARRDSGGEPSQAGAEDLGGNIRRYIGNVDFFEDMVVLSPEGRILAGYFPETQGRDLSGCPYVTRIRESNDADSIYVSNVMEALQFPDDPYLKNLGVSKGVYDENGTLLGIVVGFVNADVMAGFTKRISFGETGIAFVIDADNFILYHPEPEYFDSYTKAEELSDLWKRYAGGQLPLKGPIEGVLDGKPRSYYYAVIDGTEMMLVLRQDSSELTKENTRIILLTMLIWLLTLAAAALFAMRFSNRFVRPIVRLKDAFVSGREQGEYVACHLPESNELGDMSESYNTMIKTLKRQYDELQEEKSRNEHLAFHDVITGLYNKAAFERKLYAALPKISSCGILFLDLDGFKQVNDVHGHPFGDALLRAVAQRILGSMGRFDLVSRVGGDEFILMKEGKPEDINESARYLLNELRQVFTIDGTQVFITSSIGAVMYPEDADSVSTLVKFADISMYAAKSKGKNAVVFFSKEMRKEFERQSKILEIMRTCTQTGEAYLLFQPEYDFKSGRPTAFEALMRIRNTELGMINPTEFIPIAETDKALINTLGLWALRSACRFCKRLVSEHGFEGAVSVNVSAEQLMRDDFADEVLKILREEELPGGHLRFEIIQSIQTEDLEFKSKKLAALRKNGVSIALDDFGASYTSFDYLIHLPLDVLKIDRSLLIELEKSPRMSTVMSSITAFAHAIGLRVVAEGVETGRQAEMVGNLGCDVIQGFYLSHPLSEDEAVRQLTSANHPRHGKT